MTKLQARRVRKLARFLRTVPPKKFNMIWLVDDANKLQQGRMNLRCNTAGCIAGWANAIFPEIRFNERGDLLVKNKVATPDVLESFFGAEEIFCDLDIETPKQAARALLKIVAKA